MFHLQSACPYLPITASFVICCTIVNCLCKTGTLDPVAQLGATPLMNYFDEVYFYGLSYSNSRYMLHHCQTAIEATAILGFFNDMPMITN